PQLAILTVPALGVRAILDRRRRAVAAGLATLVAMLVVPFVAAPAWPAEWLGVVGPQRAVITGMLPTAWGFAGDVLGNVAWGAAISVAAIGAVVAISRRVDDLALLALASPLSLVVTPHAWSYDFLLLSAPWAFVLSRAARAPSTTRMLLLVALLVVASPLPWILYGVGFRRGLETLSVTIPIATALLAAIATRLPAETAATRPASA
ncbi:MAG TPA: hypothetical protein VJQ09_04285, partial [Candidatus Limnocylindria bacterium]|nr:hypothetical protein [Candidatus Limnocylindria bacterium]